MKKQIGGVLVFLLAAASGLGWTFLLTGRAIDLENRAFQPRSWQVKEVDSHGRITWTRCDEWQRIN